MRYLLFCLFLSFYSAGSALQAQEVQLNEDPAVSQLAHAWVDANRADPRVAGWRVQIMASTDRAQVEEGQSRFKAYFPGVAADWIHEKPYYKLRVGAFRSRLEALAFIGTLGEVFAGAYPAKDANINPRLFLD